MIKRFFLALSFLTIIPSPYKDIASSKEMSASLYFYPLVGFIIGLFLCATAYLSNWLSLGLAGDALVIAVWIILTGGLHLDGLMDSADGLFSCKDREKKLEIMRDSRIGAMGAIALALILLLKLSSLNTLNPPEQYWALLLAAVLGRSIIIFCMQAFTYARKLHGLGNSFGEVGIKPTIFAVIFLFSIAIFFKDPMILIVIILSIIIAMIVAYYISNSLGGHTGDSYGAMCELSETIFLVLALIFTRFN